MIAMYEVRQIPIEVRYATNDAYLNGSKSFLMLTQYLVAIINISNMLNLLS